MDNSCWNCGRNHNNDWDDTDAKKCEKEWKEKEARHKQNNPQTM